MKATDRLRTFLATIDPLPLPMNIESVAVREHGYHLYLYLIDRNVRIRIYRQAEGWEYLGSIVPLDGGDYWQSTRASGLVLGPYTFPTAEDAIDDLMENG